MSDRNTEGKLTIPYYGGDHLSLKVAHHDGVGAGVRPEEVAVDPVASEAVGRDDVVFDHDDLLVALIDGSPFQSKYLTYSPDKPPYTQYVVHQTA